MSYLPELEWTQNHSEIRDLLASLFSEPDDIRRLVDQTGMSLHNVSFSGNTLGIWHNVVHAALRSDSLTKLVETARKEYPSRLFHRITNDEAQLVVVSGSQAGMRYHFNYFKPLLLGRSPSADISIDDKWVSRFHACIFSRDRGFYVKDLSSKNGTFLNDERVTALHLMLPGNILKLGQTHLCYSDPEVTPCDLPICDNPDISTLLEPEQVITKAPHLKIPEVLENSKCFRILLETLESASLLDFLMTADAISLFAPTDDIHSNLPKLTGEELRATLNTHILNERLLLSSLNNSVLKETMQKGAYIRLNLDVDKRVIINQTRIVARDIPAANGVIHIVDSWLNPTLIK